jgi:hypothetical protein
MVSHHQSVSRGLDTLPHTTISSKRARKSWFQGWPYPFSTEAGLLSTAEPSILGIRCSSCSRIVIGLGCLSPQVSFGLGLASHHH